MFSGRSASWGARWWRRARWVKPRGSRRNTQIAESSAWARGSVNRSPGTRCPVSVVIGSVIAARASAPSGGAWRGGGGGGGEGGGGWGVALGGTAAPRGGGWVGRRAADGKVVGVVDRG